MKTYAVVFTPEAEEQLAKLYRYIEREASPRVALRYTSAIVEHCEKLQTLPQRGTPRDDLRPGIRVSERAGGHLCLSPPPSRKVQ